jgi:ankyrin repeat protein
MLRVRSRLFESNEKRSEIVTTRAELSKAKDQQGGHTELMRAALAGDLRRIKELLGCRADVNQHNNEGRTALMFAAVNGEIDCAKALLEHGADVNAKANHGGTALLYAAPAGNAELVQTLLARGADVSARYDDTRQTPLMLAKEKGDDEVVQLLKNASAEE